MKFVKWIWRLVVVGLIYISLSLTLTSPVELKVDSTAGLVRSSINKVVDQANNSDLQMGVSFHGAVVDEAADGANLALLHLLLHLLDDFGGIGGIVYQDVRVA